VRFAGDRENPSQPDILHCHGGSGLLARRRAVLETGRASPGYASANGDWYCKLVEAHCDVRYLGSSTISVVHTCSFGSCNAGKMPFGHMLFAWRRTVWESLKGLEPVLPRSENGVQTAGLGVLDCRPEPNCNKAWTEGASGENLTYRAPKIVVCQGAHGFSGG
jgi:hypothetical protein